MFDIGWSEMALILMVALIVIGPKDLPRVARTIGKWTGKARGMAREFQRSIEDMAREAELQDIKAEMDKLSRVDVRHRHRGDDRSRGRPAPQPGGAGRPTESIRPATRTDGRAATGPDGSGTLAGRTGSRAGSVPRCRHPRRPAGHADGTEKS